MHLLHVKISKLYHALLRQLLCNVCFIDFQFQSIILIFIKKLSEIFAVPYFHENEHTLTLPGCRKVLQKRGRI
jgi:hypothetical protein